MHKTISETLSQPIFDSMDNETKQKKKSLESSLSFDHNIKIEVQDGKNANEEPKPSRYKQRKQKKLLNMTDAQRSIESRSGVAATVSRRTAKTSNASQTKKSINNQTSSSSIHTFEDLVCERCPNCGETLQEFSEEELGMCIVILAAYIHRETTLAVSILPEILKLVSKFSSITTFSWQSERY